MRLTDIFEERRHLPLRKGALSGTRDSYAAFVCVMRPRDFIRLTTHNEAGVENIIADTVDTTLTDFRANKHEYMNMNEYDMPFLNVRYSTGEVLGHEGRHRAALIIKAGGTTFPCVLYMKDDNRISLKYRDWDSYEEREEEFGHDSDGAKKRQDELEKDHRVEWNNNGGGILKGEPARSDGWDKAAWKPEDAPKQLIGQFNKDVVVTQFRVGLVKGYHHFRR